MHKIESGQSYLKGILTMIPMKFILNFIELYSIFYEFWNLKGII
jgi:hypothetical protein